MHRFSPAGWAFVLMLIFSSSAHSSIRSMIRFFAVEFDAAKTLRDDLKATHPRPDSNEEYLLQLVTSYMDEIGNLGILLHTHYERKSVPPEQVAEALRSVNAAQKPLIRAIPPMIFKKFNLDFLHKRRDENEQATQDPALANSIWYRAMHYHEPIDFYEWFKKNVTWSLPSDEDEESYLGFFDRLAKHTTTFSAILGQGEDRAFDWAYEHPSICVMASVATSSTSETPTPNEPETRNGISPPPKVAPHCLTPLLQKRKKGAQNPPPPAQKSTWDLWWQDLTTTSFREFRENLGPTLLR